MASRTVHCVKLNKEADGLERPPVPGELGQKIWRDVSQEAWKGWLGHQTMLINEYRLTPFDPETRDFLTKEMEKYFFGDGSSRPDGFVDPAAAAADPASPESPAAASPESPAAASAESPAAASAESPAGDSADATTGVPTDQTSTTPADSAQPDPTSVDTN